MAVQNGGSVLATPQKIALSEVQSLAPRPHARAGRPTAWLIASRAHHRPLPAPAARQWLSADHPRLRVTMQV